MMIFSSSKAFFVLIVSFCVVQATIEPSGTVSVDCGSAQNFTCMAPRLPIVWNITGLRGINIPGPFLARYAALDNSRIMSTDTGHGSQIGVSRITISGFSISDNGGIIQCVNMNNNSTMGMATLSVCVDDGLPSCPLSVVAVGKIDKDAITVTWQHSPNTPPVTSTTVTYCPTSSPNCGNSVTCTSPCTIRGLDPGTEYQFTVIPNNNNGSPAGCRWNTVTAETACIISCPTCTCQPAPLLAGIVPTVVLLLANVLTGVGVFLITRHCYKKTSQKSSSKGKTSEPDTYEDIVMTDSPAYGPVN